METLRTVILLVGWPILIGGSIYLYSRSYKFYLAVQKNAWGRLVLAMVTGWLLTMYSLGLVSSAFMYVNPQEGTPIVLPIFGLWFITMIMINRSVLRWNDKAVELNEFNLQLKSLVDKKTAQLSQEKEMAEAERNKLKVVIASITDGVLAIDLDHKIILGNEAVSEITGYKIEELIGSTILNKISFSENGRVLGKEEICPIRTDGFEGSLVHKENVKLHGKDSEKYVTLTVSQIKESLSAKLGCIMVLHDTTKDQQLEEMKIDFVSMAAHELRTPLTSIRGYISLLKEEFAPVIDKDGQEYINRLDISSENLGRLIDNLLNVSRIERNSFKVEMEPIDILPIMKTAVSGIAQQAKSKNQQLIFEEPSMPLSTVMADGFRIGQVMTNLLANAVNYTQEGGQIKVTIVQKHKLIHITVSDTGQGIPKDALPRLFTKFFRISGILEQGSKGNGLGLYITKSIIDMHKGHITVESELGKGSTFHFTLPTATQEEIEKHKQQIQPIDPESKFHHNLIFNKDRLNIKKN